jgi:hypothetical protein
VRVSEAIYQFLYVDGAVRRVIADTNGDGLVEYELWDTVGSGRPDRKAIPQGSELMVDWDASGVV